MDSSTDQCKSEAGQPTPFSAVVNSLLGKVRWLFGFFSLTEADQVKAGISVGRKGRDR